MPSLPTHLLDLLWFDTDARDVRLLEVGTPELDDVVRVQDDYNR